MYDSYRVADALLKTGDSTAAFALYQKTVTLAEANSKSDPQNTDALSELARVYSKLAAAHFSMTTKPRIAPPQRRNNLKAASSWYQKSLKVWVGLREKKALQGADLQAPDEVQTALAKCEAALLNNS